MTTEPCIPASTPSISGNDCAETNMTNEHRTPSELEGNLEGCWVVVITDPNDEDTTLWPVMADDIAGAVTQAVADWHSTFSDPDDPHSDHDRKPHVAEVMHNSWLGGTAWSHSSSESLGTYDMSKLANPR